MQRQPIRLARCAQTRYLSHQRPNGTEKIAVFVDAENISPANIPFISNTLAAYGSTVIFRCYGAHGGNLQMMQLCADLGIDYVMVEKGPESTDIRLAYDTTCIALSNTVSQVAICAGDTDYAELASQLRKHVMVHGFHTQYNSSRKFFASVDYIHKMPIEGGEMILNRKSLEKDFGRVIEITKHTVEDWEPNKQGVSPVDPMLSQFFATLGETEQQPVPMSLEEAEPPAIFTNPGTDTAVSHDVSVASRRSKKPTPAPPGGFPVFSGRKTKRKSLRETDAENAEAILSNRLASAQLAFKRMEEEQFEDEENTQEMEMEKEKEKEKVEVKEDKGFARVTLQKDTRPASDGSGVATRLEKFGTFFSNKA